jgi:hypothetical protein
MTRNEHILESFLTSNKNAKVNNLSTHYAENENQILLRNYGTLIAVRRGNDVKITSKRYSATTSRIQNALERMANNMGMNVSRVDEFEAGGTTSYAGGGLVDVDGNPYSSDLKYYQPRLTDEDHDKYDFPSFAVFKSKSLAKEKFPNHEILEFSGDDIEEPMFIDGNYSKGGTTSYAGGGEITESDLRKRFEGYTDEELQIYNGDNEETLKNWNRKDAIDEAIETAMEESNYAGGGGVDTYKDFYQSQGGIQNLMYGNN